MRGTCLETRLASPASRISSAIRSTSSASPVSDRIPDEHDRIRIVQTRDINGIWTTHIDRLVVPVRSLGQERLPAPIGSGNRNQRSVGQSDFRIGPLLTPEIWLDRYQPGHLNCLKSFPARPNRHVMGQVPTRTITGQKALGRVSDLG